MAGILGAQGVSRRLVRRGVWGRRYPFPPSEESEEGAMYPPHKKNKFFTWNGVFWCVLSGTFCQCPCQINVEFSAWSGDLVDIEDVLLENSEYSVRIMGLISCLLHYCIVMQVIWCVKFWNITKSGGGNLHKRPHFKFWGFVPLSAVIYAHVRTIDGSRPISNLCERGDRLKNRALSTPSTAVVRFQC